MSARPTRPSAADRPSAVDRSSVTLRLPTLSWPKNRLEPDLRGRSLRMWSPSGASILITSAPRSAIILVQYGPAIIVEKSTTVRPDSAPAPAPRSDMGAPDGRRLREARAYGGHDPRRE